MNEITPDAELLRRYAEEKSEAAFAELVRRHLDLVYSTALRQLAGDTHLAQDVAQSVFTDLARKAPSLAGRAALAGGICAITGLIWGHYWRTMLREEFRRKYSGEIFRCREAAMHE